MEQNLTLARDEEPLATANYGHVRLDQATAVDLDGDGKDELVATIDNLGSKEVNVDPKLPPLYYCSYADLQWDGLEFFHVHTQPCTQVGVTNGSYRYYLPDEFPTFADFDGDGLPDRAWLFNTAGWIGSNNPNDKVEYEYSPAWQVALNTRGQPGEFGPPTQYDKWEASPGVVTDLDGDGRAELTSEALKSSLTLDDNAQWGREVPDSIHQPLDAKAEPLAGLSRVRRLQRRRHRGSVAADAVGSDTAGHVDRADLLEHRQGLLRRQPRAHDRRWTCIRTSR